MKADWKAIDTAPHGGVRILVTRIPSKGTHPIEIVRWGRVALDGTTYKPNGWKIASNKLLRWTPPHWTELPEVNL